MDTRYAETRFTTPWGVLTLFCNAARRPERLRAWDAADEYLLHHLHAESILPEGVSLLIVNDDYGALACALQSFQPTWVSDSFLGEQALASNLQHNAREGGGVETVDSLYFPSHAGDHHYDCVLLKIPKSLAQLEDQLCRIRPVIDADTVVIAAGMSRHIHTSTLALFEKWLGETHTSLARKKARLVFSRMTRGEVGDNPFPVRYDLPYQLDGETISLLSHAAVFSAQKLDIGTRFFLQHIPVSAGYRCIVDQGCGNGALGLLAAIKNPQAELVFTDDSLMAIDSAMQNVTRVFGETRPATFLQTDCLQGLERASASLVLCNPPFHRNHAVGDEIAWRMFGEAGRVLEKNGELWVIGNRGLGYHAKLKKRFGNVEVVASNRKFTLLKARKKGFGHG